MLICPYDHTLRSHVAQAIGLLRDACRVRALKGIKMRGGEARRHEALQAAVERRARSTIILGRWILWVATLTIRAVHRSTIPAGGLILAIRRLQATAFLRTQDFESEQRLEAIRDLILAPRGRVPDSSSDDEASSD